MDEIKLGQLQGRGAAAAQLLESEMLKEVFAYLETEYLEAWKRTRVKDIEPRERLWQAIQIVGLVQEQLKKWVVDGRIASKDLANIKYLKR